MKESLSFVVFGKPQPRGSKKSIPVYNKYTQKFVTAANGRPVVSTVDDNPKSGEWMQAIAATARIEMRNAGIAGLLESPVALRLLFVLPRPKGHFGAKGNVKPSSPWAPAGKPDTLKLARAVEDALTGAVWKDDSQVVTETIEKRYGSIPGVVIEVSELPETVGDMGLQDYDCLGMESEAQHAA